MEATTATTIPTYSTGRKIPGYNTGIAVWFSTDRKGREIAHRWSQGRAIRMPLADAKALLATGDAVRWPGHPLR